jgi:predicted  nucleic acid-binding Zn-ribbon protein
MQDSDRTASLMTPAKLAQAKPKAAVSPAAWLDQMAADAGHLHVRRLAELKEELQAQARLRDFSALAGELAKLADKLPRLDFGLLQTRGWWARTTGKSRDAGAEFASQFEQIEALAKALAPQVQALQQKQQEQASATERTLMEVDVEYHAVDKVIDQGARWLQDMRNQLKQRQAIAADAQSQQQIKDDTARCELLVTRLKALRAVSSAALQAHQQAHAAAKRRTDLVRFLQQTVASNVRAWKTRVSAIAAAAGDSGSPALSVEGPMDTHRELQLCIKQTIADCAQLQAQESALGESLAALGTQLQAMS